MLDLLEPTVQELPQQIGAIREGQTPVRNSTDVVVEVKGLKKRYSSLQAVDDISFAIGRGEVFGLLGPNGAGKTTTVEIIEGLRSADTGEVTVLGRDAVKNSGSVKQQMGVQLQVTALYPRLTVSEILSLFASFYHRSLPVADLMNLVGLTDKKSTLNMNLSGGQQQRLSVALALVNDPEVVFLDEPTTGLDPQARHSLWDVIRGLRSSGKTVLLTTHYMEEAEQLCDRVAIVDHGKIIAIGAPTELISTYFRESVIEVESQWPLPEQALRNLPAATNVVLNEGNITLYTTAVAQSIAGLLELSNGHSNELRNLFVRHASLEDVFLKLTGRRIRE